MQEFYAAKINSDQTEGRGPMITKGIFTTVEAAYSLIQGQGVMGFGDGDIELVWVFDTVDEWKQHKASPEYAKRVVYSGWQKKWRDGYEIKDLRAADPEFQLMIEKQREKEELDKEVARLEAKFGRK